MPSLRTVCLRGFCAIAVCTAYVLPSIVRLVADVGHTVDHVLEDGNRRNGRSSPAVMVHTHDGSTHGHRIAVGQLLESADRADEERSAAALFLIVPGHLPIDGPQLRFAIPIDVSARARSDDTTPWESPRPTVPPPRA